MYQACKRLPGGLRLYYFRSPPGFEIMGPVGCLVRLAVIWFKSVVFSGFL